MTERAAQKGRPFSAPVTSAATDNYTSEDEMNPFIVGFVASTFASTAFAQAAMQTPADKAKQAEVQSMTTQGAQGADISPQTAGMAADKDKAQKGKSKKTTTKQKQAEVAGATKQGAQGADISAQQAGMAADKDKAQKNQPKPLTTNKQKQNAVESVTEQAEKQRGSP